MRGLILGLALGLVVSYVMIHHYQNSMEVVTEEKPKEPTIEELTDAFILNADGALFDRLAHSVGGLGEPGPHSIEFFAHAYNSLSDRDLLMVLFDYRSAWDPDAHEVIEGLQAIKQGKPKGFLPRMALTAEDTRVVQSCFVRLVSRMLNSDSSVLSYLMEGQERRSCAEHNFMIGEKPFSTYPIPEHLKPKPDEAAKPAA